MSIDPWGPLLQHQQRQQHLNPQGSASAVPEPQSAAAAVAVAMGGVRGTAGSPDTRANAGDHTKSLADVLDSSLQDAMMEDSASAGHEDRPWH
jgi:hypothetical protein